MGLELFHANDGYSVRKYLDTDFVGDYLVAAAENNIISIEFVEEDSTGIINLSPKDAVSLGEFLIMLGEDLLSCEE